MRIALLLACWIAAATSPAMANDRPVLLVFGDSISAAHGVGLNQGWVAHLRRRLQAHGAPYKVVNASVSGETTSGGRARLRAQLRRHHPAIVVLELGGNDGLRGQSLKAMQRNLSWMIERSQAAGARVLLLGIRLPPNYGTAYIHRFTEVYRRVAHNTGVAFVPKVLAGVGDQPALMQADGIHPNAAGHARIAKHVWPTLKPLLKKTEN